MGINPFDQPNVESAKVLARDMATAYARDGRLPEPDAMMSEHGITVYGNLRTRHVATALEEFLADAEPGDYIAIQAYVTPTADMDHVLGRMRHELRDRFRLATTVGYGPRFLHSTGQMHKGDRGNGWFIQLVGDDSLDLPIPGSSVETLSSMTFGVLKRAQSLGDRKALIDTGRRVIRFDLGADSEHAIGRLTTDWSV
jgi:hypothetical protein